ncbi:MAG: chorismate mutase [Eubacteriales bacterium]|jgi:chorismate mutase/prephenate dehydratase|nr:chorismate mutase [Eubacteriales bacterium]
MAEHKNLYEIREELDKTDAGILELFTQRMKLSGDVARYKEAHDMPTLRPQREKEIIDNIRANADPEISDYAADLFIEIMRLSRKYQESLRSGGKHF